MLSCSVRLRIQVAGLGPADTHAHRRIARLAWGPRRFRSVGFSLLELSVVLVVIALITSAIVVGRDLARAAAVRSAASQAAQLEAALGLFFQKYAAPPGDYRDAYDAWPGTQSGNGDGQVDEVESYNVWYHMTQAGLLSGTYASVTNGTATPGLFGVPGRLDHTYLYLLTDWPFPAGRYSHYLTITALSYPLTAVDYVNMILTYDPDAVPPLGMSTADAEQLDAKVDDGRPLTGRALSASSALGGPGADGWSCPSTSGENLYNRNSFALNCGLWIMISTLSPPN